MDILLSLDYVTGSIMIIISICIYFLANKSQSARLFSGVCMFTGVWSCFIYLAINSPTLDFMKLICQINHLLGTLISTTFLLFAISYPYEQKFNWKILLGLSAVETAFCYLFFFTDKIISGTFVVDHLNYFGWSYGPLISIFTIYFLSCWFIGIGILYKKYLTATGPTIKRNLGMMLTALVIGVMPPAFITIILPQIGIFDYYWLSPVSGLLWVLIIAYAITRHQLFSIKIIAVELITFILWILLFIRVIFAGKHSEIAFDGVQLIVSIIIGIALIRSVLAETRQREKIERLENELKKVCG